MMIEHVALYTRDLDRLSAFYQTYLDGTEDKQYENPQTGLKNPVYLVCRRRAA